MYLDNKLMLDFLYSRYNIAHILLNAVNNHIREYFSFFIFFYYKLYRHEKKIVLKLLKASKLIRNYCFKFVTQSVLTVEVIFQRLWFTFGLIKYLFVNIAWGNTIIIINLLWIDRDIDRQTKISFIIIVSFVM